MRISVYTSITLNYLPKARALAQSFKRHHPEVRFSLLVAEPVPATLATDFPEFDEVVTLRDLDIPDWEAWTFKHSVVEICTAIKGRMLVRLLSNPANDAVLYFDPDTVVFSRMDDLFERFATHSILLTPHLLDPESSDSAIVDNELCALQHGVYNLGFLAVKRSDEGLRFAQWWQDRLDHYCYADIPAGIFTDQRWVDLAPAFFREVMVVQDRAYNVATWNIAHRHIDGDVERGFTVNGAPLRFYHFSGFDSGAQLAMLERYAGGMKSAFLLRDWYIARCAELDSKQFTKIPWRYSFFDNGEKITSAQRALYRRRGDLRRAFPNPFDTSRLDHSFLHWYRMSSETRPAAASVQTQPSVIAAATQLGHFVHEGLKGTCSAHPLIDADFYLSRNPDVAAAGINPWLHYISGGAQEGRDPHPLFDTAFYLSQAGAEAASNPLAHYLRKGALAGLNPHPLFDSTFYRDQLPTPAERAQNPLVHFVTHPEGKYDPHPLIDLAYFIEKAPQCGGKALLCLLAHGASPEQLRPSRRLPATQRREEAAEAIVVMIADAECDEALELAMLYASLPWVRGVCIVGPHAPDASEVTPGGRVTSGRVEGPSMWDTAGRFATEHGDCDVICLTSKCRIEGASLNALREGLGGMGIGSTSPVVGRHPDSTHPWLRDGAAAPIPMLLAEHGVAYMARECFDEAGGFKSLEGMAAAAAISTLTARAATIGWQHSLIPTAYAQDASPHSGVPGMTVQSSVRFVQTLLRQSGRIQSIEAAMCAEELAADLRRIVLCIGHHLGGGTEKHIRDLAEHFGGSTLFLFLRRSRHSSTCVQISSMDGALPMDLYFDISGGFRPLIQFVQDAGIELLHVHHLIGLEDHLRDLVQALGLPFIFTIHDYYLLAPNPHLTDGERFVGEPDGEEVRRHCLTNSYVAPPASLEEWRLQHDWLLKEAQLVIAPSTDVQRRFHRCYPEAPIVVVPHPNDAASIAHEVTPPSMRKDEPLRVVLLGALAPHKGSNVLEECAEIARERGLPLEFLLIGYAHRQLRTFPESNLRVFGPYTAEQRTAEIERFAPHLAWFPVLCPETFSYTLTEVFEARLPVAVGDLGSLPERISGRAWSWVIPWNISPEQWVEHLLEIRSQILAGAPVSAPRMETHPDASLYERIFGSSTELAASETKSPVRC